MLSSLLKVVRNFLRSNRGMYLPPLPDKVWVPERYEAVGTTTEAHFVDGKAAAGGHYMYYVVAEYADGQKSAASNIVTAPSFMPASTYAGIHQLLNRHAHHLPQQNSALQTLNDAQTAAKGGDLAMAAATLKNLYVTLEAARAQSEADWAIRDVQVALRKLVRRTLLAQEKQIPADLLWG